MKKLSRNVIGALLISGNALIGAPSFSQNVKDSIQSTSWEVFDVLTHKQMDSLYVDNLPDLSVDRLQYHCSSEQFNEIVTHYVLNETNAIRQENGVSTLSVDSTLMKTAYAYAQEMAKTKHYSHISLQGKGPWDRAIKLGYPVFLVGENIAYNQETINEALLRWKESKPHFENIVDPRFTDVGIACVDKYWVVVFGTKKQQSTKQKD